MSVLTRVITRSLNGQLAGLYTYNHDGTTDGESNFPLSAETDPLNCTLARINGQGIDAAGPFGITGTFNAQVPAMG